jgi:hypothetical protein
MTDSDILQGVPANFLLDFHQVQKESGWELVNQPLP